MSVCESAGVTRLRYDECVRECWCDEVAIR
jgi:hypothetical protein